MLHLVHPLGADALEGRQAVADEGAVGEDGHGLALMPGGDVQDGGGATVPDLLEALPVGGPVQGGGLAEIAHHLGLHHGDGGKGPVLPVSHVDLPQVGPGDQGQALGVADGPGGGHGAEEVAGIDGVHGDVPEPLRQGLDLAVAVVGDEAVIVAVHAAVEVALGLGMPDEIDLGHEDLQSSK